MRLEDHRPDVMSDASPDSADDRSDATLASAVTPNSAFRALADSQRRAVLSYLHERPNEIVTVETLAEALTHETAESDQRHVAAVLATVQLPKLDTDGIIDYDSEQRTVEYTDSPLVNELLIRLHE